MPRDIRSYFLSSNSGNHKAETSIPKRKRRAVLSDEEETKTDSPKKRSKVTKKPQVMHVLSDSDSDDNIQRQKKDKNNANVLPNKKASPKKVVSIADVFGTEPLIRIEAEQVKTKLRKLEAEIHDEDEFEETLKQLDTSEIEDNYFVESTKRPVEKHEEKFKEEVKSSDSKDKKNETSSFKSPTKPSTDIYNEAKKRKESSTSSTEDSSPKKIPHIEKPKKPKLKASSKKSNVEIEHKISEKKSSLKKPVLDRFEERIEKKQQNAALYQRYLQRGGARNPGSKKIPEGADNCLAGLSFLITGVLESLEREEAEELIKKYGGRILTQITKKTDYLVIGDQAGPAKLAKAESFNIKKISEDDLLELIATRPAGKTSDIIQPRKKDKKVHETSKSDDTEALKIESEFATSRDEKVSKEKLESKSEIIKQEDKSKDNIEKLNGKVKVSSELKIVPSAESEALAEKYRPKSLKQIIGQQGERSNAVKLYNWLKNWHKNQKGETKAKRPNPWDKNDNGAFFKAALLSGPPGIGKTTTVQVVCKEQGFDLIEFNASDTRSKKLLKEQVSEIMSNTTMKSYFTNTEAKTPTAKQVLLMDEVDGMAGNEDRGGLQELINMIKTTDIPIVCICNDRNNPKMRTLANYTYDLRFQKPRLEQIRGAMKSMCFKEKIKISTEDLDRLIESTNQDIRQVINHLALFTHSPGHQEKSNKKHANKDLKLGPWDVVRQVFSAEEHKSMTFEDKCDLFYHDYNIAPLFVQENYLSVNPNVPKDKVMERVALSAESLALGDVVEATIRGGGPWSLLPIQACFSSAIPGTLMSGHITAQINFPSWLGRNSKMNKFDRLRQELTTHARLTTTASKEAMNLDYASHLKNAIIKPLIDHGTEGVDTAINIMNNYHLLREDLDALAEITLWPSQHDIMQDINSKVKAAFTRAYNKNSTAVPYVVSGTTSKKKGVQASQDEGFIDDEGDIPDSDENEDDLESDRMIKAKKPSTSKKVAPHTKDTEKPAKRGKGRGKAK